MHERPRPGQSYGAVSASGGISMDEPYSLCARDQ